MFIVVISSVIYHLSQKSIHKEANPFFSLIVTYGVALGISLLLFFLFSRDTNMGANIKNINWASLVLGGSIVFLEMGYLLVYRTGWSINIVALFSNVITIMILILIGVLFYKEKLTPLNVLGIVMSIVGLILMKR